MGFGPGHLIVEENSFCNYRCFFDLGNDIMIGKNCAVSFGVIFINSSHQVDGHVCRAGGGVFLLP